jgi:hypothetical protein
MATRAGGIEIDTSKLDRMIQDVGPKASQVVRTSAFAIEGDAKTRAPIDTSALRNSIKTETNYQGDPLRAVVTDGVEYGIYQELGFHHYISGQFIQNPFMIPALEAERPKFKKAMRRLFK